MKDERLCGGAAERLCFGAASPSRRELHSTKSSPVPRDVAPRAESTPRRFDRLRRLPWLPLLIVALLLVSALFAVEPIRDAATGGPVDAGTLRRAGAYLLLGPISAVLDTITLLSLRQHVAFVVTLVLGWALWWWWSRRETDLALPLTRRAVRVAARVGIGLAVLAGVYAVALLVPRPMASLETAGPNIVAVDFHAHTKYSHDGRWNWEAEDVRDWHRKAGFDVAYIADHRSFDGAREGWANNPSESGTGTILLPAIEAVWKGEHVIVLDADRMYRGILDASLRDIDDDALRLASLVTGNEPVLIWTIPGNLSGIRTPAGRGTPGVRALEVVDGSPRGLTQSRLDRARIVHIADSANVALVAGSDSHGWGYAASAWTMMLIPGWRGAPPEEVSRAIASTLRDNGNPTTRVVERYIADTDDAVLVPFTVPIVTWGMFRSLSSDERIVWFAWVAALTLLARLPAMRRRTPGE